RCKRNSTLIASKHIRVNADSPDLSPLATVDEKAAFIQVDNSLLICFGVHSSLVKLESSL
ncbi:MAG: hypothetical protein WAN03_19035, partial [Candidatus Sulfotelmatobacter sp.]